MSNGLISLTRQTESVQGYQLTSSNDMLAALQYITGGHYTGSIVEQKPGGTSTWFLSFTDTVQGISSTAFVGDWIIIENNANASVCPAAQFASMYTTA